MTNVINCIVCSGREICISCFCNIIVSGENDDACNNEGALVKLHFL